MRYLFILIIMALLATGVVSAQGNSPRLRPLDFSPFGSALAGFSAARAAEIDAVVHDATVTDVQAALSDGKLTSVELTLYFLDRIRRYDDTLRSFIELNPDALKEAQTADELRASGKILGPLHGIPVNLKDNIETTAPMHTTGGAEILLDNVPAQDAPLVKQLRDGGAVILGKAALSELAGAVTLTAGFNAVSGQGVNAYKAGLPVAGSSSGSGISTSAYLTLVSVGTETSGSLIAPSTVNGVVGMKPSRDLVSGKGVIPLISYQDSPGPIARNVTDAAILLGVIDSQDVDYTAGLSIDALKGVPVGVLRTDILAQPPLAEDTSDNAAMLTRIDAGLKAAGAVSSDVGKLEQPNITYTLILGLSYDTVNYLVDAGTPVSTLAELQAYNRDEPDTRIPRGQEFIDLAVQAAPQLLQASGTTADHLGDLYRQGALADRSSAEATLAAAFKESGVEVFVSMSNTHSMLYATAGYPAITVPLGLRANGAPVGVTLIGKQGDDAKLLAYAYAFEQATRLRADPKLP